jgi:acyl transferase domain-containing protein
MTLPLKLSAETEEKLREKAARYGQTLEAYLEQLAVESTASSSVAGLSVEEWLAQFRAWVASHRPLSTFVDDSRESIYEDRAK